MMLLAEEMARITGWMRSGVSVVVVGAAGTGRTTLARAVADDLGRDGTQILELEVNKSLPPDPYGLLIGHGVPAGTPQAMTDALTRRLLQDPTVVVVDDAARIDPESAAVLGVALRRAGTPVLATRSSARSEIRAVHRWFPVANPALITLRPLTYEQTNEFVHGLLDGPIEPDLVASVHAKSSGIPGAADAIVRSAVRSETIRFEDGVWQLLRDDLWNEHLRIGVERRLAEVSPEEFDAAYALAILGSMTMGQAVAVGVAPQLARLEDRGLVTLTGSDPSSALLTLRPLAVVDYFRDRLPETAGLLIAQRIGTALGIPPDEVLRGALPGGGVASIAERSGPVGQEYVAWVWAFEDELAKELLVRAGRWEDSPTVESMLGYVSLLWETRHWRDEALRVIEVTDRRLGDTGADDLVVYTFVKAYLHAFLLHDAPSAIRATRWLEARADRFAVDAAAIRLFLGVVGVRIRPRDIECARDLVRRGPDSWMTRLALLAALTLAGEAEQAMGIEDLPPRAPEIVRPYARFFEILALLELHRYDDALEAARRCLGEARRAFDRPLIHLFTFAAAHCLFRTGRWSAATQLISETLALGSPGSRGAPSRVPYEALLRMGSLLLFFTGQRRSAASLLHGVTGGPDGPMSWMQHATGDAIRALLDGDEIGAADHVTRGAVAGGRRGYVLAERVGYLYAVWLDPTVERLDRLDAACVGSGDPGRYAAFRGYARSALKDPARIVEHAMAYGSSEDLSTAVIMTRRIADRAADPVLRGQAEQAAELLADALGRDTGLASRIAADPVQLLTDREYEVALLAGSRSNAQIAAILHLSRRTVENHIHRALKKSGVQTREELTLLVGRSTRRR